jgi:hypothetical protein
MTDDTGDVSSKMSQQGRGKPKRRIYDKPATPFERLKHFPRVDPVQIAAGELKATLNPFALKRRIESKLRGVLRYKAGRTKELAA